MCDLTSIHTVCYSVKIFLTILEFTNGIVQNFKAEVNGTALKGITYAFCIFPPFSIEVNSS